MDQPNFLLYPAAEHEQARNSAYVRDLIAWLEWELKRAALAESMYTRQREFERAYFVRARADALADVIDKMHPAGSEPLPEGDGGEDYDHPNLPPAARKAPRARTQ